MDLQKEKEKKEEKKKKGKGKRFHGQETQMSKLKENIILQIVTEELSSERDLLTVRVHVEVCTLVVKLAHQLEVGPALHSLSKQ